MHIIGGTYLEHVNEPYWHEIFGSGMRATSILASVCNSLTLSTYLSEDEDLVAEAKSGIFGFHLMPNKRERTISFSYFHGLSRPHISPHLSQMQKEEPIFIDTDECILRFGMIEGDAIVHGKTVVYDPQSAFLPAPFHENGSKANRLAIILNAGEALSLTKERSVSSAGELLSRNSGAEVVVIKRGPFGCLVFSKEKTASINAYKTERVFPIGSGDVFTAMFTHYWGEEGLDANEAANNASIATAHFCNFQIIPLPRNYKDEVKFPAATGAVEGKQVYLAGPFFTTAQRWLIEECVQLLQQVGVKVFSPYHSVGIGTGNQVYSLDIEGLEKSDVIFACLDGLDSGTIYEVGYAKAIGKQVIVFVQNESKENLKMITGAGCRICNDLVTALYEVIWTLMES
jgi:hypothetical protein